MITKGQRHELIKRIIRTEAVWSQQELQERLHKSGVEATQATLSRDLQQMGVLKGAAGYVLPSQVSAPANGDGGAADAARAALQRTLTRELRAIDAAGNLAVIRTDAGHANALAVEIDRARLPEILGSIAGDDTILLAMRTQAAANRLARRFKSWTSSR